MNGALEIEAAPAGDERSVFARRIERLTSLLDLARRLAAAPDIESLLRMIVDDAGTLVDADRCSLFLVDRDRGEVWSKIAHGIEEPELRFPLGQGITGYAAVSGEVLNVADAYADPRFNRAVDSSTGYMTKSMLVVPMRRAKNGDVLGLLLALNKKSGSFTPEDEEMLSSVGAQAAAAIENAFLREEINQLFDGFIRASVVAIESRDPSTSGHSERVATLTLGLAEALEKVERGPYAHTQFKREELRELRYAALLHDFGKVGVRENVLLKGEKLYPSELENLRTRFALIRRTIEVEGLRRKMDVLAAGGAEKDAKLRDIDAATSGRVAEAYDFEAFVLACNRPSVVARGGFERLKEIASRNFIDGSGVERGYLSDEEVSLLAVARGSLSEDERREIESHVVHTYRFLAQIPWTRELKRVPEIAYLHHEKLNGGGYPRQLTSVQIPIQARMMTIADIYDALTANDRSYKKAVPHHAALDILREESAQGGVDKDLFEVFVEADVPAKLKLGI
jgi:HD-GYP domain-containing protein (c-di-GMP phosphodiesterase class II)